MNTIVQHVEDLAQLNDREQPCLGHLVVVLHHAQLVEEDAPGDEVGQIQHGVSMHFERN